MVFDAFLIWLEPTNQKWKKNFQRSPVLGPLKIKVVITTITEMLINHEMICYFEVQQDYNASILLDETCWHAVALLLYFIFTYVEF